MKIVQAGIISTGIVIILGIVMVIPYFMQPVRPQVVLLSFSIVNDSNLPQWCNDLASVLKNYNIKASVFVTGKLAQQYPECVSSFPNNVDVGSQTYDYVNLASIHDYTVQLEEIKDGKRSVDYAGNIDSKLFKAPYGSTDKNIYSLLNRAGIVADFSYDSQYNKFYNGKFIKFNTTSYDGSSHSADFFRNLPLTNDPIIINFDSSTSIQEIDDFISKLKSPHINFVNTSEITGFNLTTRNGEKV